MRIVNYMGVTFQVKDTSDYQWFWNAFEQGTWEPDTLNLMNQFLKRGWQFIDIGAWIGPTSLFAQKLGADVTSYECDSVAYAELKANNIMNDRRLDLVPYALYDRNGILPLFSQMAGNSESSVFSNKFERSYAAETTMLESVRCLDILEESLPVYSENAMIKIDIEGGEFVLIPRLRDVFKKSKCLWYISFHELNVHSEITKHSHMLRQSKMVDCLCHLETLNWYNSNLQLIGKDIITDIHQFGTFPFHQSIVFTNQVL